MTPILLTLLSGILYSLAIFYITAICYVAVMHWKILKDNGVLQTLHWSSKAIGYTTLYIGLVFDMLLNVLVMTAVLLELPKEVLTTSRIKRWYWNTNGGWRHRVAVFFAKNYLLPFDKDHMK